MINKGLKLSWNQIQIIISQTPADLKGSQTTISQTLGVFVPSGANWGYVAGWTYTGILVVTRFGEVM